MSKCRACLSTELRLVSFDNTSIESYNLLTSLNVKESDGLPQALCELCFNKIEGFVTFRFNCINSEEILKAEYESCQVTNNLPKKTQFEFQHIKEVEGPIDDNDTETNSFMDADEESLNTSVDTPQIKVEDEDYDDMEANMDCVICNLPMDDVKETVLVKKKGLKSLIKCSGLRKDGLLDLFTMVEEIRLHDRCRLQYTILTRKGTPLNLWFNKPDIYEYDKEPFDFNTKCFICTKLACPSQDSRTAKYRQIVYRIKDETTRGDIVKALKSNETMKNLVILHRIENVNLIETGARYHRLCYLQVMMPNQTIVEDSRFLVNKPLPRPVRVIQDLMTMDPKFLENTSQFPFDTHCFFCAQTFMSEKLIKKMPLNKRRRYMHRKIQSESNYEKIIRALEKHDGEAYRLILQRINNIDLMAIAARFHYSCHSYYVDTNRLSTKYGRPTSNYVTETMDIIYKHIADNHMNHFHITDLEKLVMYDLNMPDTRTIKRKLVEKYGDNITITNSRKGMSAYVTFHDLV